MSKLSYESALEIVRKHDREQREEKDRRIINENKKLVGTCYKFRNSYGGDNSKWRLYVQIVGVDETSLICDSFEETTMHGKPYKIEMQRESRSCYNEAGLGDPFIRISNQEFNKAKRTIVKKMGLKYD